MSDRNLDVQVYDISLAVPPGRFPGASPIYRLLNLVTVPLCAAFGIALVGRMFGG